MTTAVEKPRIALKNILFTTDFSEPSLHALPFAITMARRYDAHLVLAHVLEQVPMSAVPMDPMPADMDLSRERAERKMEEFRHRDELLGLKLDTVVEPGFLWPVVAELVEQRKIDMIVLGTHGRGAFKRVLLGSAAEEIFRHATCPVMTIGPHVKQMRASGKLEKILFATDFSSGSVHALDCALKLVAEHDAQLLMIHVVQASAIPFDITDEFVAESEAKLKDMIAPEAMPAKAPLFLTLIGVPSEQILNFAEREDADLIVMGMHKGTELASRWPLECAAKIIAGAKCPVLSVRSTQPEKQTVRRTVDPTSLP